MDMAFLRHPGQSPAGSRPEPLDHHALVAALAAQRDAAAAQRPAPAPAGPSRTDGEDPLTAILLAAPGWRDALRAQGGCFSRAEAKWRRNES